MVVSSIDKDDIITGERIQALCDVTITCHQVDTFHSSLPKTVKRCFLETPNLDLLESARVIFVYTHLLHPFQRFIFPQLKHKFVLVTHNSDDVINEAWLSFLENEKIIHWFAQSCTLDHPKITCLPIGIANAQWRHGDLDLLYSIMNVNSHREKTLYVNFNPYTNALVRFNVANQLEEAGYSFVHHQNGVDDQERYLLEMKHHQYVACPVGNSPDTHRFWEALYLGCVPIVDLPDYYSRLCATHLLIRPDQWCKLDSVDTFPIYFGFDDVLKMSFWQQQFDHKRLVAA